MKVLSFALIILVTISSFSWGQAKKPRTLDELAAYSGADRAQILLDGAKAESSGTRRCRASIVNWSMHSRENTPTSRLKSIAAAARTSVRDCSMKHKREDTLRMRSKALRVF